LQSGTAGGPAPQEGREALERMNHGEFSLRDVDQAATAAPTEAIPELEKQFTATEDATVKGKIASALVHLADKHDTYWDYLVEQASPAIGSDMPDPTAYEAKGKRNPDPSPKFVAWAKAHKLTTEAALELYGRYFRAVAFLGESRDPRAIPFLRQALLSPNFMLQILGVAELAQFQDKSSISLIIDACHRAPGEIAQGMARDLLKFDDPRAQAAAEEYLPKDLVEKIVAENRQKNQKK